jgi:arylsulfatase A-like enzyme
MSTHYSGVQVRHDYTRADDVVPVVPDPQRLLRVIDTPDRYDDKVAQTDDYIRQIFSILEGKGYLKDALFIVTGDHGEGLGERHYGHGRYLYNEDMRVPLLLYDGAAVRYPNLVLAAQVDIAPTILDRVGIPVPTSWAGRSLLTAGASGYSFHQTSADPIQYAIAVRTGDHVYKYLACPSDGSEELYDLVRDPGETHNLMADADPAVVRDLRDRMVAYLNDPPPTS